MMRVSVAILCLVVALGTSRGGILALPTDAGTSSDLRMSQSNQVRGKELAWTALSTRRSLVGASPCSCAGKVCGCCQPIKIADLGIDTKACANVTFLSEQIGATLFLSFDGKVLFKKTVSVKNPEPVCVDFPGKFGAKICGELYKLSLSPENFEGCARLEAKLLGETVATFDLGCFKMPFKKVPAEASLNPAPPSDANGDCSCSNDQCQCCTHIRIKELHLDSDVCIQVQFLSAEIGVSLSLTVDGKVIFKKTLSLKDPPPICVPFAGGTLCVELYNVAVTLEDFSGCGRLEAKFFGHTVAKVDLGCFKIPLRLALYGRASTEGVLYLGDATEAFAAGGLVIEGGLGRLSPVNFPLIVVLEPNLSGKADED